MMLPESSSSFSSLKRMAQSSNICIPVAAISGAAATPVAVTAVPIDVALRSFIDVACPYLDNVFGTGSLAGQRPVSSRL